jgi:hypothetical protein
MNEVQPTRPRRRWGLWIAASLALILVLVLVVSGWLWSSAPAYWAPRSGDDPMVQSNARKFENAMINTAHRKPTGDWSVTITQEQMNQWLAARLPQWLANQNHPLATDPLPDIMVAFFDDRLELAFDAKKLGYEQIFRLVYTPTSAQDDQTVQLILGGVYGGRLPLPKDQALKRLAEQSTQETADGLARINLASKLADGRHIRVLAVQMHDGKVVLKCRTTFNAIGARSD